MLQYLDLKSKILKKFPSIIYELKNSDIRNTKKRNEKVSTHAYNDGKRQLNILISKTFSFTSGKKVKKTYQVLYI